MTIRLSRENKLLIPTYGLIGILIFFASIIIISYYGKIASLNRLHDKIVCANAISDLIHSLQKERGLSGGLVAGDTSFADKLTIQRHLSDHLYRRLEQTITQITCSDFKQSIRARLFSPEQLADLRHKVDQRSIQPEKVIERYTHLTDSLLSIIVDIAKQSHIPDITQTILTYIHFLYLKEYTGLERAQGVAILSNPNLQLKDLLRFSDLIALQKENASMLLQYADTRTRRLFLDMTKTPDFKKVKELEDLILDGGFSIIGIRPVSWYEAMTKKMEMYDGISKFIEYAALNKISAHLREAQLIFIGLLVLMTIGIAVFLYILKGFLRLAKEERKLRQVMDKYVISSITDPQGIIIDVSEAFCAISGYTKEELIGKPHNIVRHPDTPKETFMQMWRRIKRGRPWKGKIKNLRKDGGHYWVYANIEPLFNDKGEIDSFISIRIDITENERLQEAIEKEAEKNRVREELLQQQYRLAQMGEMLSMIAHQWRQPLSAITAAAGSLIVKTRLGALDPQTAHDHAEKIKNFSQHLSATIDDFRNFFKSNKTRQRTTYREMFESVRLIVESSLRKHNIRLELEEVGDPVTLETYENELKQVILNLIKNAEEALVERNVHEPRITVRIEGTTMTVSDNAGGIPQEFLPRIFDPYFSTKGEKNGTGLGLYMSKLIVEDHCGGRLTVHNGPEGAVFNIILGENAP